MATPAVTLITNAGPYVQPNISPAMRKAIIIYGKLGFTTGGTYNYTNSGVSLGLTELKQAVADMQANVGSLNPEQVEAARAFLWPKSSISVFNAMKVAVADQIVVVNYLSKLDIPTLNKLDLWAEYVMNVDVNALP